MKILIDADGCPVVDIAVGTARKSGIECTIICDTAHSIKRDGAKTIIVDKGADSADFRLVNLVSRGDIVITQDYGLAAMCLSKCAILRRIYPVCLNSVQFRLKFAEVEDVQRECPKELLSRIKILKSHLSIS